MAVHIAKEDDLRNITYENQYVSVKYHNDDIPVCHELYKVYERLSNDEKYSHIYFVRVNADENQIAQKLIDKDVYSFMAIYKKGLLIESATISGEEDIVKMLDKLASLIEP